MHQRREWDKEGWVSQSECGLTPMMGTTRINDLSSDKSLTSANPLADKALVTVGREPRTLVTGFERVKALNQFLVMNETKILGARELRATPKNTAVGALVPLPAPTLHFDAPHPRAEAGTSGVCHSPVECLVDRREEAVHPSERRPRKNGQSCKFSSALGPEEHSDERGQRCSPTQPHALI